jgi:hypothetical protein
MSEPITWRSISAPNFGASAALLNSGSDTMNQGFTSLANLANGIADKQKGIEVSNAVAALGKATNDSERGAIFDANAANLRDHGIDLKDLIAADQARHLSLNSDAELVARQAMNDSNIRTNDSNIRTNDSTIAGNVIQQKGYDIANDTASKTLENLGVKQTDEHNLNVSNINTNTAQVASAVASANNSNDAISERSLARLKGEKLDADTTLVLKMSQDPKYRNADGTANIAMMNEDLLAQGVPLKNIVAGIAGVDAVGRRPEQLAAAALVAEKQDKRDTFAYEQNIKDASKARDSERDSTIKRLDTDGGWYSGNFGQDSSNLDGSALITSAYGTTYTDASGKKQAVPSSIINQLVTANQDKTGDLILEDFTNEFKKAVSRLAKEK